jgi:hypothetical protein
MFPIGPVGGYQDRGPIRSFLQSPQRVNGTASIILKKQNAGPGMIIGIVLDNYGGTDPVHQVRCYDAVLTQSLQPVI